MDRVSSIIEKVSAIRIRPSLQPVEEALKEAGLLPQKFRKVIVAGTNGKGTTAWGIYNLLRKNDVKAGVFLSPHLCSVRERIQINGEILSENEWISVLERYHKVIEKYQLTYYEVTLFLAYHFFTESKIDVAVMEVGMGGRWDATNVGTNDFAVITGIDLDHQEYLGHRRSQILREKVAVIKENTKAYLNLSPSLLRLYRSWSLPIPEKIVGESLKVRSRGEVVIFKTPFNRFILRPPVPVSWWRRLFLLAVGVSEDIVGVKLRLPEEKGELMLPGRWDVRQRGSRKILLDVAHNPQGWNQLIRNGRRYFSRDPWYVVGVLKDKNWKKLLHKLPPNRTVFVSVGPSSRRIEGEEVKQFVPGIKVEKSVKEALKHTSGEVVITGSFYAVADFLCEE